MTTTNREVVVVVVVVVCKTTAFRGQSGEATAWVAKLHKRPSSGLSGREGHITRRRPQKMGLLFTWRISQSRVFARGRVGRGNPCCVAPWAGPGGASKAAPLLQRRATRGPPTPAGCTVETPISTIGRF